MIARVDSDSDTRIDVAWNISAFIATMTSRALSSSFEAGHTPSVAPDRSRW
jgi:hypothetical protein